MISRDPSVVITRRMHRYAILPGRVVGGFSIDFDFRSWREFLEILPRGVNERGECIRKVHFVEFFCEEKKEDI